jgi:uncharacterized protein (UPF0333 family)
MSKKFMTGAVIALAAGIATYLYRRNRDKINAAAANAYNAASESLNIAEEKAEQYFS